MVKPKSPVKYLVDDNNCWIWMRSKTQAGYGFAYQGGKQWLAHRLYYHNHKGPIPEGMVVDHLCGNKSCVNPDHLEAVTQMVNLRRWKVKAHAEKDSQD